MDSRSTLVARVVRAVKDAMAAKVVKADAKAARDAKAAARVAKAAVRIPQLGLSTILPAPVSSRSSLSRNVLVVVVRPGKQN